MNSRRIASLAEEIAVRFLTLNGHEILATNYRYMGKEIDIVTRRSSRIIFVEVKFRASERCGLPREAVTRTKQRHILTAARGYLAERGRPSSPCRFDVIEIRMSSSRTSLEVVHLAGAFTAD